MSGFFKQLAETLKDRQELRMTIKKIGDELVIIAVPNFKDEGKSIHLTGSPEEMDLNFVTEINKPLAAAATFTSNADEVAKEVKEEAGEEVAEAKAEEDRKKKAAEKKQGKKPTPAAKKPSRGKKVAAPAKTDPNHEKELKETLQDEPATNSTETVQNDAPTDTESQESVTNVQENDTPVAQEKVKEPKDIFEHFMKEGKRLMDEHKYSEAEASFQSAVNIFPEDKKAQAELFNAKRWVRAKERLNEPSI